MGSGFYSFEEAGKRLGRSKRSLHDYVKSGLLRKSLDGGVPALHREDVDLLAVDLGAELPALNRRTFLQMQSRLQKMEDQLRAVMHALEIRNVQPMRPDHNTASGLISACTTYLYIEKRDEIWTPVLVDQWIGFFEMMDEETFNAFSKASNDPQAWVPFFKLCSEMTDFCWEQDRKAPSLAWQARAGRLETSRKHLRGVVVTWLEMGRGTLPQALLESLSPKREALLGRVAKAG